MLAVFFMKSLIIENEVKTIDGCMKIINIWQFRQRKIYFEIVKIKKIDQLSINELNRYRKLAYLWEQITNKIESISSIFMQQLIFDYYDIHKKVPIHIFLYSGYCGKESIFECENLELSY